MLLGFDNELHNLSPEGHLFESSLDQQELNISPTSWMSNEPSSEADPEKGGAGCSRTDATPF